MKNYKWLIKNGYFLQNGQGRHGDILIDGDKIADIGMPLTKSSSDIRIINAEHKLVSYGLADVHVHFREPGFSYKETIATGSREQPAGDIPQFAQCQISIPPLILLEPFR